MICWFSLLSYVLNISQWIFLQLLSPFFSFPHPFLFIPLCMCAFSLFTHVNLQSERVWKGLDLLLLKRFGIVLRLLVDNLFGPAYNHSLLFEDGVILSRYFTYFMKTMLIIYFLEKEATDLPSSYSLGIIPSPGMDHNTTGRRIV